MMWKKKKTNVFFSKKCTFTDFEEKIIWKSWTSELSLIYFE